MSDAPTVLVAREGAIATVTLNRPERRNGLAGDMLARLYLDGGEDPQIAEVLARQSAALMPERQEFWDTLVLALTLQGRHDDALKAAARSRA